MNYALRLDLERCVGCMACAVACMDQNDLDVGSGLSAGPVAWRQIFAVESGDHPEVRIRYVSLACMHCEIAPCINSCPTGAITRNPVTHAVVVESRLCIGCHSCATACPFGVPRFRRDGTMQKCDLCSTRLENGLEPACVRVCSSRALAYGDPNSLSMDAERKAALRLAGSG
jgi:anaerobic dimethyl sulfoxide reductase subunit B (iron-sulfur subunit)